MPDATDPYRRQRLVEINALPGSREAQYEQGLVNPGTLAGTLK